MRAAGVRPPRASRVLTGAVAVALAYVCATASPAPAAFFDPCGLVTEAELATAFGLADVVKRNTVVSGPGDPGGVVRNRCETFAWMGSKPTNEKRKRESLLAGTMARLTMQSWAPDEGAQGQPWRARFDATLKRLRGNASALFLKQLHGARSVPPRFGADSGIAFSAAVGGTRKVRALWWSRDAKSLLVFDAVEAKGQPTLASVKQVASIVASEFFRRP